MTGTKATRQATAEHAGVDGGHGERSVAEQHGEGRAFRQFVEWVTLVVEVCVCVCVVGVG